MKLNLIENFLKVCELNSITRAADELDLSKGQLSQQIKMFEQNLGLTLFSRSNKGIELNDTGQLIYQHCVSVIQAVDDLIVAAALIRSSPEGRLKICSGYCYAQLYLLPYLKDFHKKYPAVETQLDLTEKVPDLVNGKGQILLGLSGAVSIPEHWKRKRFTSSRFILCASVNYFLQRGYPKSMEDLSHHQFIAHELYTKDEHITLSLRNNQSFTIKPHAILNSTAAMIDLATQNQGIIATHEKNVENYIHNGLLVEVLPNQLSYQYDEIYLHYPEGSHKHPNIRIFVDFISKIYNLS